jgi:hypothetical protein
MCLFVILFPTFGGKKSRFLREVHPYSGLDPQTWDMLQSHLSEFENQKANLEQRAGGLYRAIEDVRNLALFIQRADDHEHQEKLESIAVQMGVEGETTLFELARNSGMYFFPKYLNDLAPKDSELDVNRTGAAIDGHFPDPKSHGQ